MQNDTSSKCRLINIFPALHSLIIENCAKSTLFSIHSRAIGSRQGSPSHESDLNKNSNGSSALKDEVSHGAPQVNTHHHHHQHLHHQPPPINIDGNSFSAPVIMDQHFGTGPPGLANEQSLIPPFHGADVTAGPPHMMGGHNGGPSPPMHGPLGGPLGLDGMMDLQQVGHQPYSFYNNGEEMSDVAISQH